MENLFEGKNIRLRAVEPEDAKLIHAWENNTENWVLSNTLIPYSLYTMKKYAETASEDIYEVKQLRLIIEKTEENKPIGAIDLFDFDPYNLRAGIGILIHDKAERQNGYASEALQLIKTYAFDYMHMKQIYCTIPVNNNPSIKLFEKAGFEQCGVRKDWLRTAEGWIDEAIYQCFNVWS